jgi:alpha-L-fucosidase
LIGNIVDTVSKNGLVLMNIALRGDGTLPEDQAAILRSVGDWLAINGEGIYGTRPWKSFGEGPTQISDERQGENLKAYSAADIRFTTKDGNLYAFVLAPPTEDILIKTLGAGGSLKEQITSIALLGSSETLEWSRSTEGLAIKRPRTLPCSYAVGFRIIFK